MLLTAVYYWRSRGGCRIISDPPHSEMTDGLYNKQKEGDLFSGSTEMSLNADQEEMGWFILNLHNNKMQ